AQDAFLLRLAPQLACAEVRLLDPASFKLRTAAQRRKSVTVTIRPKPTRKERLAAAVTRAEAEAFSLANEDIVKTLRKDLRLFRRPLRISAMPMGTAHEVLRAMQAVEA